MVGLSLAADNQNNHRRHPGALLGLRPMHGAGHLERTAAQRSGHKEKTAANSYAKDPETFNHVLDSDESSSEVKILCQGMKTMTRDCNQPARCQNNVCVPKSNNL